MPRDHDIRVLITGAAGFGGSGLARALLARGYTVTGLDIVPPSHANLLRRELSDPGFHYLWKSIQDIQPKDVEGHSVVAHMAAQPDAPLAFESPRYTVMQNIEGTVSLLEAVRQADCVSKLMFAGSGNEIGRALHTLPIDEDHPLTPHNPYGFSKAAAEMALEAWHLAYDVPSIVMRTGVVIGPQHAQGGLHIQVAVERIARQAHSRRGRQADSRFGVRRRRDQGLDTGDPCSRWGGCGSEVLRRHWSGTFRRRPGKDLPRQRRE